MRRRDYLRALSGTGVTVAGGCLFWGRGGGNWLVVEPVPSLADHVATGPGGFTAGQSTAVAAALDGGEHVTYGRRPFRSGEYVRVEGAFYQATVAETGTERVARWVLGGDPVEDGEAAVPLEAYPPADRDPVAIAYRLAHSRARADDAGRGPDRYVYVFRRVEPAGTALLPTPRHPVVDMPDGPIRLWTERRDIQEPVYTTTLEPVAADGESFERRVEDELVADLDDPSLPPAQREIVETAIETGEYRETDRISDPFNDLVDRLQEHWSGGGTTLFKYDGAYYEWTYTHSD